MDTVSTARTWRICTYGRRSPAPSAHSRASPRLTHAAQGVFLSHLSLRRRQFVHAAVRNGLPFGCGGLISSTDDSDVAGPWVLEAEALGTMRRTGVTRESCAGSTGRWRLPVVRSGGAGGSPAADTGGSVSGAVAGRWGRACTGGSDAKTLMDAPGGCVRYGGCGGRGAAGRSGRESGYPVGAAAAAWASGREGSMPRVLLVRAEGGRGG